MNRLLNQIRVQSLAAILLAAGTVPFGCTTTPDYPQPAPDKAQIVVKVTATPKVGAQGPRTEGQYDKESVEKGRRFTRVNYSKMDCIAVVLNSWNAHGWEPRISNGNTVTELAVGKEGFEHDLSLAFLDRIDSDKGNRFSASVDFQNRRESAITLFGATQDGNADALFEVKVPAGGRARCNLLAEGLYDIYCDEDEALFCQIIATKSANAALCESGGETFFDGLGIGEYEVEVYAPRLPMWKAKITTTAGKRETLYAEVTVNSLPKK